MIGSLGSSGTDATYLKQLLGRLDTDSSGSVTKTEFTASSSDSSAAEALFDALDSGETGEMSLDDLASAFQSMSSVMQSTLLEAQESGGRRGPDFGEMFAKLDSDGDGGVTEEEFFAGKPDEVSDEQAQDLWQEISGGADSLSADQFTEAMAAAGPPPGPPPGGGGGKSGESSQQSYDPLDTNQDGTVSLQEMLAGASEEESGSAAQVLMAAMDSYRNGNSSAQASRTSMLSVAA